MGRWLTSDLIQYDPIQYSLSPPSSDVQILSDTEKSKKKKEEETTTREAHMNQ